MVWMIQICIGLSMDVTNPQSNNQSELVFRPSSLLTRLLLVFALRFNSFIHSLLNPTLSET